MLIYTLCSVTYLSFVMKTLYLSEISYFAPRRKCIGPLAIAAIGAASSLANSYFQASTNAKNADLSRELQESNQNWQEDMYNKYYSPSAQIQQLRDAGVNPAVSGSDFSGSTPPSSAPGSPVSAVAPRFPDLSQSLAQAQQMKLSEEQANVAKQESVYKIIQGGSEIAKTFGYEAGRAFIEHGISILNLEGQDNYQRLFDIQYTRQCLETDLRDRFGEREYKSKLDAVYQGVNESAVRIGKMLSDASVNDAKIKELASEVAKNFAQAGLFSSQSAQITSLLPYMEENLRYVVANSAMDFLTNESGFAQESYYRDWQHSDKAKDTFKYTQSMDSRNNVVGKFMREFVNQIPAGAWQQGFNYKRTSSQYGSNYEYVFGQGWQMK